VTPTGASFVPLAAVTEPDVRSLVLVLAASSLGALLSKLHRRVVLPTVVLEIVLGIAIGPEVLGWAEVDAYLEGCIEAGAGVIVLAAFTGTEGYDDRPELDEAGWRTLLSNLDRIDEHARSRGVVAALHPHVGTMIEREAEVDRVLEGSRVGLCLDTGHLLVGGTDPVALTRRRADRVVHVHLKDVDASLAADVRDGKVAYGDAIRQGLFRPLGEGDVDLVDLVRTLEGSGYDGWYVLEQDIRLRGEPEDGGPVAGVRSSLDYLRQVAA